MCYWPCLHVGVARKKILGGLVKFHSFGQIEDLLFGYSFLFNTSHIIRRQAEFFQKTCTKLHMFVWQDMQYHLIIDQVWRPRQNIPTHYIHNNDIIISSKQQEKIRDQVGIVEMANFYSKTRLDLGPPQLHIADTILFKFAVERSGLCHFLPFSSVRIFLLTIAWRVTALHDWGGILKHIMPRIYRWCCVCKRSRYDNEGGSWVLINP